MNRRGLKILTHLLCWLFFICLVAAFLHNGNTGDQTVLQVIFSGSFILFTTCYIFIFYLNQYVLMPHLFLKKRYTAFAALLILLLAGTFYMKPFEQTMRTFRSNRAQQFRPPPNGNEGRFPPPHPNGREPGGEMGPGPEGGQRIDIISLILFFMSMAVSAMLVLSKQWRQAESNKALIEAQKANAELAFLKAQISPHFLFNVLNNIYALAITKNEQTASSILRLSNIMRYVTDEARTDFVPIEKEIACINDYIALQKIRLSKKVTVHYTVTGTYGDAQIAPLILMSFVENCFKHGISNNVESEINIHIYVDRDLIRLETSNPVIKNADDTKRAGIGLQNVTQRLEHLYKNNYKLGITPDDQLFKVSFP
ncbi:sensor histidine kinase [Niabella hibiscisoli]|uniref:sensor histidine kinase n=1 Tax=Niabella hibiscisoli TaxID=1825928 RepID=UPI001F10E376|nr:histidine kinase [Niabella hibiscisoli]MCH5717015.1 histidine kinase [Niabella hibiscisoli]